MGEKVHPALLKVDDQYAISLSKNLVHHERTKHIKIRYHFILERVWIRDRLWLSTFAQVIN